MAAFNLGSLFLSPTPNTPAPTETHRIIQLVQEGNLRKLKKLITEKNINELHPCSISIDYITPLMAAAKSGREDICTFLLKEGANPNMLSINKQSVLNYASYSSVNIVKQLIAANADPNVIGLMTPVQFAATIQRDDIVKELILSGASPEMCVNGETHEKVLESLKNLASKSQDFVTIKKLYDFTVTLWGNAKPEEVLTQYREDLQEEHPVHHHTMVEVCFSLDNVDLHRLCIEALQKTKKLDVYANEISSRLSRVTMCYKQLAIKSLNAVCCVLREIPLELSINVVPTLLELLIDPRISCEMHYTILTLLYVIVQKTSGRQYGWEKLFIENLCKGVISFTATEYPPDVGIVAYAIIADLYEYQCVSDMITEMRITSVPEKIIQTADMGMNEEMKERIRNLNSALSKKCYSKETGDNLSDGVKNLTLSKKKKKKKKKKRPGLKEQSKGEEGIISEAVMESSVIEKTQSRFDGKMGTPVEEVGDPQPTTTTISGDSSKDDVTNPFIDLSKKFPRRWHSISVRWKSQLQMLANMDSSHMTKVGSLNFKVSDQCRIAKGNDGTEVYLGLRDDGTEVAIKRILKSNYEALKHELSIIRLADLDSPHIVHYVDFAEDEHFGYLVLQLCEYSLEEYITDHLPQDNSKEAVKELLRHIFSGLSVLHKKGTKILHRDIKPQNVLIDITGKARLADFGISRKLHVDQTTLHTKSMGTRCWMPWEAIDQDRDHGYKRCSDIQVAGMLMYYTLSGGHHPFGNYISCEVNILKGDYNLDRVQDDLAKDLIEWMITCEPEKRPSIEEVLIHPYFWTDKKKVEYLVKVGNEEEVVKRDNADVKIVEALEQLTAGRSFSQWKSKLDPELVKKLDRKKKSYPENTLGLLRFIRNLHEHWKPEAAALDLFAVFPDLFSCVYKFAKANGWNERIALRTYFED